jgi:hypothetical protein
MENENIPAGSYANVLHFNADHGIYFAKVKINGKTNICKFIH